MHEKYLISTNIVQINPLLVIGLKIESNWSLINWNKNYLKNQTLIESKIIIKNRTESYNLLTPFNDIYSPDTEISL